MTLLAPGERLTRRFAFTVERADTRVDAAAREGRRRRG
ncbi:aldose 1-epimerase, partial [Paraburkholderia sp. SIMBA_050]